jgi:hypothetical protein
VGAFKWLIVVSTAVCVLAQAPPVRAAEDRYEEMPHPNLRFPSRQIRSVKSERAMSGFPEPILWKGFTVAFRLDN